MIKSLKLFLCNTVINLLHEGLLDYLIFAELLRQAEDIADNRQEKAGQVFDNALRDPHLRFVQKCNTCIILLNVSILFP
jgi:hypothetical protein